MSWFRKAAEQGHDGAQLFLSRCYAEGTGVKQDETEAYMWLRLAALHGNSTAQLQMGVRYRDGVENELDRVEAYAFFNLVAAELPEAGRQRDQLESVMTKQQVATAQKRTRRLRATIENNTEPKQMP